MTLKEALNRIFKLEKKGLHKDAIIKILEVMKRSDVEDGIKLDCIKHLANDSYLIGRYADAISYSEQFLEQTEDFKLRNLLSIARLSMCDLKGFDDYSYRWFINEQAMNQAMGLHKTIKYLKDWDQLRGSRVFVMGEQGFGDDIMFSHTYHKLFDAGCTDVFIYSRDELGTLFRHNFDERYVMYVDDTIHKDSEKYMKEHYDYTVAAGDLFSLYIRKFGRFPELYRYRGDISAEIQGSKRRNIAITHATGGKGNAHREREVSIQSFKKFEGTFELYNFQLGKHKYNIGTDVTKTTKTFLDTANILEPMDGVITVDTAFAHLALAMDKPTVIVYDEYLDWRFRIGMYPKAFTISMRDQYYKEKVIKFLNEKL